MKWYDENGIDVDAYPDRAFKGGVYDSFSSGQWIHKPTDKDKEAKKDLTKLVELIQAEKIKNDY